MLFITFNILKNDIIEQVKIPVDNKIINYFCNFRNMFEDLGFPDDEEELCLNIINTDTPLHESTFYFINELCEYIILNNITPSNWINIINQNYSNNDIDTDNISNFIDTLFTKYSNGSIEDNKSLFHDVLNVCNFTNCDCGMENDDISITLDILCWKYAINMIN
jgi:hypothetical protein